jgi:hypothetical protein
MKLLYFLILPLSVFSIPETKQFPSQLDSKDTSFENQTSRILLKVGPASTIFHKTKIRPAIGLGFRTQKYENKRFTMIDTTFSYSYNKIDLEKTHFSIGEIFLPKVTLLKFFTPKSVRSGYAGLGAGIYRSWQYEDHSKSPSLLSSNYDNIYNTKSFSYFGTAAIFTTGYELDRHSEITSGVQLELSTPMFPLAWNNIGSPSRLSIGISYIAGF